MTDPVQNRIAAPRRRGGRPSAEEVASRPPPAPAQTDPATGRIRCKHCGRPELVVDGHPRKSDNGTPLRCNHCGYRCVRLVLIGSL